MSRFVEPLECRRMWCAVGHAAAFSAAAVTAGETGTWQSGPAMPAPLGEVAAGVIGRHIYVVGETNAATMVFDTVTGTWSTGAARPQPGNHHAAEVVNGKLYLFGGLTQGSDGEVQIYDPVANTWSKGADMPFAAGSSSSALIGGQVFVAGGIVGVNTTNRLARYDPALDTWTELAPMPQGRNHTASGTDGQKFYVFGGRGPGSGDRNVTTNGFDTTQVYDPATNTWQSSLTPGSTLAPLPQARGGMGKAVYLGGEFYVIGGETLTGADATANGVYHRVDAYDPAANTWRLDAPMPTARHGIFPVELSGRIGVAGGGIKFGGSQSAVLEVFTPAPAPEPPPPPPPTPQPATVAGRWVFYNNSSFDGNDPAADARDDAAIAPDKQALLPGQRASFSNYTSYAKGINGIMVDVANLPAAATPTAADFVFNAGGDELAWPLAAGPSSVTVRRGAGVNGSDRITLVWPDNQVRKTWLRVSVKPGANTGLALPEVFYFGNAIGETGNRATQFKRRAPDARVNKADLSQVKRNIKADRIARRRGLVPAPGTPAAGLLNRNDFDRNGVVDAADVLAAKQNKTGTRRAPALVLIVAP